MRCAYTTLLATDDYIWGVLGLCFSLRKVGAEYPIIVMALDSLKQETLQILEENNIDYRLVEDKPGTPATDVRPLPCTTNKMHMLTWTDFDKIMYIDADIIVENNIDFMFTEFPVQYLASFNYAETNRRLGAVLIAHPQNKLWNIFKDNYATAQDDEELLNGVFLPYVDSIPMDLFSPFLHNRGEKYWKRYNIHDADAIIQFVFKFPGIMYALFADDAENFANIKSAWESWITEHNFEINQKI